MKWCFNLKLALLLTAFAYQANAAELCRQVLSTPTTTIAMLTPADAETLQALALLKLEIDSGLAEGMSTPLRLLRVNFETKKIEVLKHFGISEAVLNKEISSHIQELQKIKNETRAAEAESRNAKLTSWQKIKSLPRDSSTYSVSAEYQIAVFQKDKEPISVLNIATGETTSLNIKGRLGPVQVADRNGVMLMNVIEETNVYWIRLDLKTLKTSKVQYTDSAGNPVVIKGNRSLSPDHKSLVFWSTDFGDSKFQFIDTVSGRETATITIPFEDNVRFVQVMNDGRLFVRRDRDHLVLDPKSGSKLVINEDRSYDSYLSENGDYAVLTRGQELIRVNLQTGEKKELTLSSYMKVVQVENGEIWLANDLNPDRFQGHTRPTDRISLQTLLDLPESPLQGRIRKTDLYKLGNSNYIFHNSARDTRIRTGIYNAANLKDPHFDFDDTYNSTFQAKGFSVSHDGRRIILMGESSNQSGRDEATFDIWEKH
jgi:hypothetical protein